MKKKTLSEKARYKKALKLLESAPLPKGPKLSKRHAMLARRAEQEADDAAIMAGVHKEFAGIPRARNEELRRVVKKRGPVAVLYRKGRLKPSVAAMKARIGSAAMIHLVEHQLHPDQILRLANAFHKAGLDSKKRLRAARVKLLDKAYAQGIKGKDADRVIAKYTSRLLSKAVQFRSLYTKTGRSQGWQLMLDADGRPMRRTTAAVRHRIEGRQKYEATIIGIMSVVQCPRREAVKLYGIELSSARADWEKFRKSAAFMCLPKDSRLRKSTTWQRWKNQAVIALRLSLGLTPSP